jgi:hypothetical protein
MKRVCNCFLCFIAICFFFQFANAQTNDAQLWENINLAKNINPRLLARINHEGRITENITRPSFYYFDLGLDYKISKHFHATLAYVWVEKRLINDFWSTRHQAYFDIVGKIKWKNFQISDRQMFLWQVKDYYSSDNGKVPDYYLRNKLTIKYEKNFKLSPYIAAEIYYKMNDKNYLRYHFNRTRYFAGLFYRTNLKNEFEVYYLLEKHFNITDPPTNWIIGVGYTHLF